jgi:hypothetical protein
MTMLVCYTSTVDLVNGDCEQTLRSPGLYVPYPPAVGENEIDRIQYP